MGLGMGNKQRFNPRQRWRVRFPTTSQPTGLVSRSLLMGLGKKNRQMHAKGSKVLVGRGREAVSFFKCSLWALHLLQHVIMSPIRAHYTEHWDHEFLGEGNLRCLPSRGGWRGSSQISGLSTVNHVGLSQGIISIFGILSLLVTGEEDHECYYVHKGEQDWGNVNETMGVSV